MYKFLGLDHVQVAAPPNSENEASSFYGDILGMEPIAKPLALQKNGGVWFQCGSHQLHIGIKEDFEGEAKAHPAFEIQNLSDFKQHLQDNDVAFQEDDKIPDVERIYVFDPFGNRLEFLSHQTT